MSCTERGGIPVKLVVLLFLVVLFLVYLVRHALRG
jgi:hypothetical protein